MRKIIELDHLVYVKLFFKEKLCLGYQIFEHSK
jgi:hypothetical protein